MLDNAVRYKYTPPMVEGEDDDIMEKCLGLIDGSAEGVWQSEKFSGIGQETLQIILQRETLAADEATIYASVEKWAANACSQKDMEASPVNRREMLGAALYRVRFPVLTDTQLMNGPAQTGLLLQSELLDIFRYKHADVKPALPFRTEARQNELRAEGLVNFTVPDVRKLEQRGTLSDPIVIRKLPWRVLVKKHILEGSPRWGYFVKCDVDADSDTWTCEVNAELRLLPWKAELGLVTKPISHVYCEEEIAWGYWNFISFTDLLDPSKGYVNPSDFSLKLQVKLTAALPVGID
ncbi:uncharacterized protein LOC129602332 [Paramacrobiotus metropolitanus]|uniref:uncharacterized protein LOC129602332 n=1 Tax=Paramacrobiotus metropolitanus TaxID=2943436 RepID=UPI0024465026|nr:uncharacterized protein LOC129602332 [Paramacrobiotus metropolitanus]